MDSNSQCPLPADATGVLVALEITALANNAPEPL